MTNVRLTSQQIQDMYHAIIRIADGAEPSTYKNGLKEKPRRIKKLKRSSHGDYDVTEIEFWLSGIRPDTVTTRAAAFLRAYLAIGGDRIPARGIASREGEYLWLDKGVMKALIQNQWVELDEGNFILTGIGQTALREGSML